MSGPSSPDSLTPQSLKVTLLNTLAVPVNSQLYVAYSGGVDSHVLLHALAALRDEYPFNLHAIHVNHSLHADAGAWAAHCQRVCDVLNVSLISKTVTIERVKGESLEAAARDARYRAIAELLPAGALCMTAQHMNDQAETVLLQLLRGAGIHGLAAMPAVKPFAGGLLARPLLGYSQQALAEYADNNQLVWIEDPSNSDQGFDRNFLRKRIIPSIRERWPGMDRSLSRTTRHAASARVLLDELAAADLKNCGVNLCREHPPAVSYLYADSLLQLSTGHIQNALRHWVRLNGLPVPGDDRLGTGIRLLFESSGKGEVDWRHASFRLADDLLWLCHRPATGNTAGQEYSWNPVQALPLSPSADELRAFPCKGEGVATRAIENHSLRVTFRRGGEVCRLPGDHGMKSLKKVFQDLSIPSWQRQSIPLIYLGDELLAIGAYWYNPHFLPAAGESGYIFSVNSSYHQRF